MQEVLIWLFAATASLLIVHEVDSARWKEWELFGLPGGAAAFVLVHVPLVFVILAGIAALVRDNVLGQALALALGISGIGAYLIHRRFIRRGRPEFTDRPSRMILRLTLVSSLVLVIVVLWITIS